MFIYCTADILHVKQDIANFNLFLEITVIVPETRDSRGTNFKHYFYKLEPLYTITVKTTDSVIPQTVIWAPSMKQRLHSWPFF